MYKNDNGKLWVKEIIARSQTFYPCSLVFSRLIDFSFAPKLCVMCIKVFFRLSSVSG